MALTALSDLKAFLGIASGDTSEDALLNTLITQCSDLIEEFCGRVFGTASYTEYYCGDGRPFLVLNQRPVTAITSLYLDETAFWGQAPNAFAAATLLTEGTDYALDKDQPNGSSRSGLVFNINGAWPVPVNYSPGLISPVIGPGVGNIKVTYTAGYASVPTPLTLACNMLIAKVRNSKTYGEALVSETDEVYSYQLAGEAKVGMFSKEVASVLARYRNVGVA